MPHSFFVEFLMTDRRSAAFVEKAKHHIKNSPDRFANAFEILKVNLPIPTFESLVEEYLNLFRNCGIIHDHKPPHKPILSIKSEEQIKRFMQKIMMIACHETLNGRQLFREIGEAFHLDTDERIELRNGFANGIVAEITMKISISQQFNKGRDIWHAIPKPKLDREEEFDPNKLIEGLVSKQICICRRDVDLLHAQIEKYANKCEELAKFFKTLEYIDIIQHDLFRTNETLDEFFIASLSMGTKLLREEVAAAKDSIEKGDSFKNEMGNAIAAVQRQVNKLATKETVNYDEIYCALELMIDWVKQAKRNAIDKPTAVFRTFIGKAIKSNPTKQMTEILNKMKCRFNGLVKYKSPRKGSDSSLSSPTSGLSVSPETPSPLSGTRSPLAQALSESHLSTFTRFRPLPDLGLQKKEQKATSLANYIRPGRF